MNSRTTVLSRERGYACCLRVGVEKHPGGCKPRVCIGVDLHTTSPRGVAVEAQLVPWYITGRVD